MSQRRPEGAKRRPAPRPQEAPRKGGGPLRVVTARIESLASGGKGVARLDSGKVVLISGVCPDELVEVTIGERASSGELAHVVERSPSRVEPVCPRAFACGGCDWMHIDAEVQPALHAGIVKALLDHAMGDFAEGASVAPPVCPHRALGYRTRARLHVEGRRGTLSVGYLAARSHALVEAPDCVVLDPRLEAALPLVGELFRGLAGFAEVTLGLGHGGLPVLDATVEGDLAASTYGALHAGVGKTLAGARLTLKGVTRPSTFGDPRPVQLGSDGVEVVIAAGGFTQPSDEGGAALARLVATCAGEGRHVVELFAGSGTLSIALAKGAQSFTSVEIDVAAVAAAKQNFERRGLEGKLIAADADAFAIPKKTEVVVLDPPRAGARGATAAIASARVARVIYVSCEPSTLARDARELATAGYRLDALHTVELFPQTSHVEVVAVFRFDARSRYRPAAAPGDAS